MEALNIKDNKVYTISPRIYEQYRHCWKLIEPTKPDFNTMTKKQLEQYALDNYNVDLDLRRSKKNLIEQLENMG